MNKKEILQSVTDMSMAFLLPIIMARHLTGEAAHEWIGLAMICLFLFHNFMNYRWYKALFHGRYRAQRILNTAVNFLLIADILLMGISGIVMSAHVFSFLNFSTGASVARQIHLPCAFWGFILVSLHIGLNWRTVLSRVRRFWRGKKQNEWATAAVRALLLLVAAYGIYAFFKRRFPDYLFLKTQFIFFDYSEKPLFYLIDMISIMVLFATVGYCLVQCLAKVETRKNDPL